MCLSTILIGFCKPTGSSTNSPFSNPITLFWGCFVYGPILFWCRQQYTATHLHTVTHHNTPQHTATHCNTLQHIAAHCNTLQHTASHCITLQHKMHYHILQHTATYRNTMPHTAAHCNTLQHSATHCNTLQHTATHCKHHDWSLSGLSRCVKWVCGLFIRISHVTLVKQSHHTATHWNSLQLITTHCNSLQLTATHCKSLLYTLQHTTIGILVHSKKSVTGWQICIESRMQHVTFRKRASNFRVSLWKMTNKDSDSLSIMSLSAKEPVIIEFFCGKQPITIRYQIHFHHPVCLLTDALT